MGQISRIQEQATESEAVVRNITKDIQRLDLAKKNLVSSTTALKRFQMLGISHKNDTPSLILIHFNVVANAASQLEDLVKDRKYAEISQTLLV